MIFADNAPKYWEKGLPAIPLIANEKRPAVNRWQVYADRLPTEDEQQAWLANLGGGNIGMPMGAASGLVAIDIDTEDPKFLAAIDKVLPPSPWVRVGKKGRVQVYKYTGERTTRIKSDDNQMICEILAKGTQIVMPPSIHPETKRPYGANAELVDVLDKIQPLPMDFVDQLKSALELAGVRVNTGQNNKTLSFVAAGARDNQVVWMAGVLARGVVRGERTLVEALGEMEVWLNTFVEKVVGDEISIDKARAKVVEFLVRDVTGDRQALLPIGWDVGLSEEEKAELGLSFTDDNETSTAEGLIVYLTEQFSRFPDPNLSGFIQAIDVALGKLARSNGSISQLDEHRVLRFIQNQSNNTLSLSILQRELRTLRAGDIEGVNHTEIAEHVLRFLEPYGEIRFDASRFWQWKGAYWGPLEIEAVKKIIATEYGHYPMAKRQADHLAIMRLMGTLVNRGLKSLGAVKGLNFANGFLTEDLELVDHHPDHGMTYILPYRYTPDVAGHMPIFNQFLHDSWGQDPDFMDKVALLQEAMGVTLFGAGTQFQRVVLLYGKAGSGKSRVPALLRALLPPESYCSLPPSDWHDKFLPAMMFGKLMNFAGELSETRSIPGDRFKMIVGGETIPAQHKNQDPFELKPVCTHWFCSNFYPKTQDSSSGFSRRWLILEFTRKVPEHKQIADLEQIIIEHEAEAILAWAVQGWERMQRMGEYTLPSSHLACVDQMNMGNNTVRYYLSACQDVEVGRANTAHEVTAIALHRAYWSFCLGMGLTARSNLVQFERQMAELSDDLDFEISRRKGETVYKYVSLGMPKI